MRYTKIIDSLTLISAMGKVSRKSEYNIKSKISFGQRIKLQLILRHIRKSDKILDLGCGTMWLTKFLRRKGHNCVGFSDEPPADILGDVTTYKFKQKYDVVIALEIIEHVDCIRNIKRILRPGGILIISTPVPSMDWLCMLFEWVGLFQKRTSPHINLTDINKIPLHKIYTLKIFGIDQFGVFYK